MQLYRLKWQKDQHVPSWGVSTGFVVRAKSEATARRLASENAFDEGFWPMFGADDKLLEDHEKPKFWLDPKYTSCDLVNQEGNEEIVLHAYLSD